MYPTCTVRPHPLIGHFSCRSNATYFSQKVGALNHIAGRTGILSQNLSHTEPENEHQSADVIAKIDVYKHYMFV